jgi:hypothetical protein
LWAKLWLSVHPEATRSNTLLQVFLTDNEEFTVRSGAYFSILDVLGEAPGKHRVSLKPERFELQIDWDIIARLKEEFGL